jgi:hypothetical protein
VLRSVIGSFEASGVPEAITVGDVIGASVGDIIGVGLVVTPPGVRSVVSLQAKPSAPTASSANVSNNWFAEVFVKLIAYFLLVSTLNRQNDQAQRDVGRRTAPVARARESTRNAPLAAAQPGPVALIFPGSAGRESAAKADRKEESYRSET